MPVRRRIRAGGVVTVVTAIASLIWLAPSGPAAAACPSSAGRAIANAPDPVPRAQVVFRGHGSGHGLGMSQYGAQGAARLGCSYPTILATYYRGTHVATAAMPRRVTVRMTENAEVASVDSLTGAVTWRTGGRTVHVQRDGRVRVHRFERDDRRAAERNPPACGRAGCPAACCGRSTGLASCGSTRPPTRTPSSPCACGGTGSSSASMPRAWTPSRSSRTTAAAGRWTSTSSGWPRCRRAGPRRRSGPRSWRRGRSPSSAAGRCCPRSPTRTGTATTRRPPPAQRGATRCRRRAAASSSTGRAGRSTRCTRRRWPGSPRTRCTRGAERRSPTCGRSTTPAGRRASDNPASTRAWTVGFSRRQVASALGFGRVTNLFVFPRGDPRRLRGVRVTGVRGGHNVTEWIPGFTVRNALGLPSPGFVVKNNP